MKCPTCGGVMYQTGWRPPRGVAAYLRQFKCGTPFCNRHEYARGTKLDDAKTKNKPAT